jgi:hypothetical protein
MKRSALLLTVFSACGPIELENAPVEASESALSTAYDWGTIPGGDEEIGHGSWSYAAF